MREIEKEYLEPRWDKRKSFYKKAYVLDDFFRNCYDLYSYDTYIASINKTSKEIFLSSYWGYSQTTLRHLKEFLRQYADEFLTKQEIWEKYTEEGKEYAKAKEYRKVLREFKKEFKKDFTDEEIEEMAQNEIKY